MKLKKTVSILVAVVLVASVAAIALAENAEPSVAPTEATAPAADETTPAAASYTLNEMLTQAMADAYTRQASYTAYAQAFPDSQSITGNTVDSQIVLLEMLLKANNVAFPAAGTAPAVPETKADAYQAIAQAESNTVTLMQTYLAQESLPQDAQMIFRSVLNSSYRSAVNFAGKARAQQRTQAWTDLLNNENTKVYVTEGDGPFGGHYKRTVYVYNSSDETSAADDATMTTAEADSDTPAMETTEAQTDTKDTTDSTTEDSMSN